MRVVDSYRGDVSQSIRASEIVGDATFIHLKVASRPAYVF